MSRTADSETAITTQLVNTTTTPKLLNLYASGILADEKVKQMITHGRLLADTFDPTADIIHQSMTLKIWKKHTPRSELLLSTQL